MKIIIETNPDIDNPEEKTFEYFKAKCMESLNKFKIEIEDTDLKFEK